MSKGAIITSRGYDGQTWALVTEKGKPVRDGDSVGPGITVSGKNSSAPRHAGSSGKVYIIGTGPRPDQGRELYAPAIKMRWLPQDKWMKANIRDKISFPWDAGWQRGDTMPPHISINQLNEMLTIEVKRDEDDTHRLKFDNGLFRIWVSTPESKPPNFVHVEAWARDQSVPLPISQFESVVFKRPVKYGWYVIDEYTADANDDYVDLSRSATKELGKHRVWYDEEDRPSKKNASSYKVHTMGPDDVPSALKIDALLHTAKRITDMEPAPLGDFVKRYWRRVDADFSMAGERAYQLPLQGEFIKIWTLYERERGKPPGTQTRRLGKNAIVISFGNAEGLRLFMEPLVDRGLHSDELDQLARTVVVQIMEDFGY